MKVTFNYLFAFSFKFKLLAKTAHRNQGALVAACRRIASESSFQTAETKISKTLIQGFSLSKPKTKTKIKTRDCFL